MSYPSPDLLILTLRLRDNRPTKSLGQNFLSDEALLERIAATAALDERALALEIGPGPGTLTTMLARRAGHLLAIEYDRRFTEHHANVFGPFDHLEFIYNDALRVDLAELARERLGGPIERVVLTGNLPFQITSPLLFGQCNPEAPWARMAFMVQKEVADRLASPPGRRAYGILTVKMAYWWKMVERFDVPARAFRPRPKVDGAVVVYEPTPAEDRPGAQEWAGLSRFVDAAFNQRRKKMINSLAGVWGPFPGKEKALEALESMGIDESARAETLSPEQFRELHAVLSRH